MKKGKLIVLEGLDGSGKATQAKLLYESLRSAYKDSEERIQPIQQISFPNYESESSALVKMYLAGEFGNDPEDVNAYAASSFYAVDRYASFKKDWGKVYERGGVIIADRYTTSNAIHQCSKLVESEWDQYLSWLFHYEYDLMGMPKPDEVVYLRVDPEESQQLLDNRYDGDESKKDIHEANLHYLMSTRRTADIISKHLDWKTVECMKNGKMRDIEDIHEEIIDLVGNLHGL